MTFARLLVIAAILATVTAVTALPAAAHVELEESQPAAGSAVTTPPGEIYLRFTGPVQENAVEISVIGPDGERLQTGQTQSGARAAAVQLPELAGNGRYVVRYEGTSEDGHPFAGRLRFRLRLAATEATLPPDSAVEPSEPVDTSTEAASPPAVDDVDPAAAPGGLPWAPIAAIFAIVAVAIAAFVVRRR